MNVLGFQQKKRIFLALLVILGTGLVTSANALEIKVKKEVTIQDDTLYLKDIATFHPAQDNRIPRLYNVKLAAAPPPGKAFQINDGFLIRKLDSAIAAIPNNNDIRFQIPETLFVKRTSQVVRSEQLKEIFKDYVFSHSPWPANKIIFEKINDPGNIVLPIGRLAWEVKERKNHRFIGNISITLYLRVDGILIRKVAVSGRIAIKQELVKAAKKIDSGRIISRNDLILVTENRLRYHNDVLTNLNDAIGKRSVCSIQAGRMITTHIIEDPPVVEKGGRVTILAENNEIKIATLGRVLEDGRIGDAIRVVNVSSGKEILATVTGPGVVEVSF